MKKKKVKKSTNKKNGKMKKHEKKNEKMEKNDEKKKMKKIGFTRKILDDFQGLPLLL